jgi:hypothetical protein
MPTYSPVLVLEDGLLSGPFSMAGVFIYANKVYAVILDSVNDETAVFQSSDGGDTWVELDSADRVPSQISTPYFDGDETLTVMYRNSGSGAQALKFRDFDLATGTWGSTYGTTGAPNSSGTTLIGAVYKRPDDTLAAIYFNSTDGLLTASIYDIGGASWGSPINLSSNIEALSGWNPALTAISSQIRTTMDSTGRIHVFCYTNSTVLGPPLWPNRVFYQALETDNTLGAFEDFPGQDTLVSGHQDLEVFSGPVFGQPAILGDSILLPVSVYNRNAADPVNYPCLYIGSGLSAPTWSLDTSLSLDPDALVDTSIWWNEAAALYTDGSTLVAVGPARTDSPDLTVYGRLRLTSSTNTANPDEDWDGSTIFDVDDDPTFGDKMTLSTVRITSGQIQVTTDFVNGSDEWRYWMGNWFGLLRNTFE